MRKLSKWMVCLMTAVMAATAVPSVPEMPGGVTAWAALSDSDLAELGLESDYVELKKVPTGKAGSKISMSITIKNGSDDEVMEDVKVHIGTSGDFDTEEVEDEDGEVDDVPVYSYPFENANSLQEGKEIGNVKEKKTVTLTARVRRDLK